MLYLDPAQAGVAWLLDPDDPEVVAGIKAAANRRPGDSCDAEALAADLPDLLALVRERHFGRATGSTPATEAELAEWAQRWQARLTGTKPATWGEAIGTDLFDLRMLLGDAHTKAVQHEDPELVAAVDPRSAEPYFVDDGPAYEERVVDGVLCLRVRRLLGTDEDERALTTWRESHERHFSHDRIVVDLRGNRGGNDGHLYTWAEPHNPHDVEAVPSDRTWYVDDRPLGGWNSIVQLGILGSVPPLHERYRVRPHPQARLEIRADSGRVPAGEQPWHGRMVVVTDRRTVSSGESSAWALHTMFGAPIVGGPSEGCISYGNVVPYLLPRSGLRINLPTKQNLYENVEFAGIPVDVPLDPRTPVEEIVERFF